MTLVGITDFSIRDLIKPDAARVKKILSAIINFAKFREEQLPVFDKHIERSVHLQFCALLIGYRNRMKRNIASWWI